MCLMVIVQRSSLNFHVYFFYFNSKLQYEIFLKRSTGTAFYKAEILLSGEFITQAIEHNLILIASLQLKF